ncbi:MAG: tetratricopeptide repeat protein [Cycloclasticus sp.]|nr:tetratricopeptide repeat protein [Cycloclasticus sp.]
MYNQTPAPVRGSADDTRYPSSQPSAAVKTYPMEEHSSANEGVDSKSPQAIGNTQNPAVVALLDSAYQQREQGQLDIAVSKLERAVRISPRDASIWHQMAQIRHQQGLYETSLSLAKKSNLLAESNKILQQENWFLMAKNYQKLGQPKAAQQAQLNATRLF